MLVKTIKITAFFTLTACIVSASSFNAQAEKDRLALIKYTEAKFKDPAKNQANHFPYSTVEELEESYSKNVKYKDFAIGTYSYAKKAKEQYDEIKEMPPYEDAIEEGEIIYHKKFKNGKSFVTCFSNPKIAGDYPFFDEKASEVVTISSAINDCLALNGEKVWKMKKGKIAKLEAYFSFASMEANKKVDIKINSQEAADAYERGKKEYYAQRGYLKLSCATCHVQGAGQRVRAEKMSPLLGQTTHFPVFRLKWDSLGTLERRMAGCNKDQGENPHKANSAWMKELLYFMAYMSNGMAIDGPDVRK